MDVIKISSQIKENMESKYQDAVRKVELVTAKYGIDRKGFVVEYSPDRLTLEDRVEYEVNKQLKHVLYYYLNEYINSSLCS